MQRPDFIALIGGAAAALLAATVGLALRVRTSVVAVLALSLLIGVGGYAFVRHMRVQQAELKSEEVRRAAEAEANRKLEEAGKQRLAMEQERQARAAAEAVLSARVRKPSNSE